MSAGRQGKTTNSMDDVIGTKMLEERQSQWGEIPGEIVAFDAAKQTATIQPLYKPQFNGKPIDMPQLLEVPVRFTRAGGGGITYPIAAGDKVTLRPQMRSTENYNTDGNGEASDARSFNLSDMEAFLDGGESLNEPIENFDAENVHIRFDPAGNFGMKGSADGKVSLEGSEGNIYDLLAQVVEILGVLTTTVSGGSSTGVWPITQQAELAAIAAKLRAMAL